MAQVVLIKTPELGIDIGDMVARHNDNVELTGSGYECFTVLQFSLSFANLREIIRANHPNVIEGDSEDGATGKIKVETSPGVYEEVSELPTYRMNFGNLTASNIEELKTATKARSTTILNNRLIACVIKQLDELRV